MYSDLDKKSQGGYIIEDALVLAEIFNTAMNLKEGQLFYGRDLGYDFEKYLLRLNEPETLLNIQSDLYKLRNLDGRLIIDPANTGIFTDEDDNRILYIKTALNVQGLPWVNVESLIEDNDDKSNILTINDYIQNPEEPWISVESNED